MYKTSSMILWVLVYVVKFFKDFSQDYREPESRGALKIYYVAMIIPCKANSMYMDFKIFFV